MEDIIMKKIHGLMIKHGAMQEENNININNKS